MATLLKGKGAELDKIVCSPANRALTTAKFFANAFELPEAEILHEERIYEAYPEEIQGVIESFNDDWNQVALFGHNPGFTSLANQYTTEYIQNMPTCCIVQISGIIDSWKKFSSDNATLRAIYFPKQYFD
ncbi:MAG: histidine phosphatase family protein [Saprospiraceae bacterium]|nr:histidine phosphatase family protein [Saprospiraceae bacterium]